MSELPPQNPSRQTIEHNGRVFYLSVDGIYREQHSPAEIIDLADRRIRSEVKRALEALKATPDDSTARANIIDQSGIMHIPQISQLEQAHSYLNRVFPGERKKRYAERDPDYSAVRTAFETRRLQITPPRNQPRRR